MTALKIVPTAAPDPRSELLSERGAVIAKLEAVGHKLARLGEAERVEREAFAAIGALGAHEIEAVKIWAASGCEGDQPKPDAEARRALSDQLAAAVSASGAAKAAAADVRA
jgi:hypothetical protein